MALIDIVQVPILIAVSTVILGCLVATALVIWIYVMAQINTAIAYAAIAVIWVATLLTVGIIGYNFRRKRDVDYDVI